MDVSKTMRTPRGAVLAAGIALALFGATQSYADIPGGHHGAEAARAQLRGKMQGTPIHRQNGATATTAVTSCLDDGGSGTLRSVVAAAADGDTIDLSALTCSKITLSAGVIPAFLDNLTLIGPGAGHLAIDGGDIDRVFVHLGYGDFTLSGLTVRHGGYRVGGTDRGVGGCIASLGYVVLDHSVVTGCYTSGEGAYGGGVFAIGGLTMQSSTLSGNVAVGKHPTNGTAAFGGGVYTRHIALYSSTVSGNTARHDIGSTFSNYCTGGGVFADFGGYAFESTISGNYSYSVGGGISLYRGNFYATNTTISGNTAKIGGGGGINIRLAFPSELDNTTIANNTAPIGGGLFVQLPLDTLTLQSTLIASNHASDFEASAQVTVAGSKNLVQNAGLGVGLPLDTLHSDPLLQPLKNNGGPTLTQALTTGSLAIDAGSNPTGQTSDQRGVNFPRIVGLAPDIGAFEGALAPQLPPSIIPAPALSTWSLAAMAMLLGWLGLRHRSRRKLE